MDTFATSISYSLKCGVTVKFFMDPFSHVRFEPSGWTGNPQVPYAKSIIDCISRWVGLRSSASRKQRKPQPRRCGRA